jgi:pentatricopeptide repeat protein
MGNIGYEDYIRIGHESDALRLLDEMIEKCKIKPSPEYNDTERKIWEVAAIGNKYFLPRLEALRDALARDII